ncbi:RNA-directed DNA polymerase, eukaryota [Tanacetum coccineum]
MDTCPGCGFHGQDNVKSWFYRIRLRPNYGESLLGMRPIKGSTIIINEGDDPRDVYQGKFPIDELRSNLRDIDKELDQGGTNEVILQRRLEILKNLHDIDSANARDYMQKPKIQWAIESDENSKFFHGIINRKRANLTIKGVMVDGDWVDDPCRVKENSMAHFGEPGFRDKVLIFYEAVEWFFEHSSFSRGCNSSFIALIPKNQDPKFVNDYRPISLIGSLYKILDGPFIINELLSWRVVTFQNLSVLPILFIAFLIVCLRSILKRVNLLGVGVRSEYVKDAALSWEDTIGKLKGLGSPLETQPHPPPLGMRELTILKIGLRGAPFQVGLEIYFSGQFPVVSFDLVYAWFQVTFLIPISVFDLALSIQEFISLRIRGVRFVIPLSHPYSSVAVKLSSVTSSLRRPVRGGSESSQLSLLQEYIEGTILSSLEDRWVWDLNGKIHLNRLPTRVNLQHRGVLVSDPSCPICHSEDEDLAHFFSNCEFGHGHRLSLSDDGGI